MSVDESSLARENRETLEYMATQGVDLSVERDVEFAYRSPDRSAATRFAAEAMALGFSVEVHEPDEEALDEGDTEWDVICVQRMVPGCSEITEVERRLARVARKHGCREDGLLISSPALKFAPFLREGCLAHRDTTERSSASHC